MLQGRRKGWLAATVEGGGAGWPHAAGEEEGLVGCCSGWLAAKVEGGGAGWPHAAEGGGAGWLHAARGRGGAGWLSATHSGEEGVRDAGFGGMFVVTIASRSPLGAAACAVGIHNREVTGKWI